VRHVTSNATGISGPWTTSALGIGSGAAPCPGCDDDALSSVFDGTRVLASL
jgi:hypothetical protein